MSNQYGSAQIVSDGLVLCLDANASSSYPGSGTSWVDLTGNGNFTINGAYTYSSDPGYINLNGVTATSAAPPTAWQGTENCTIDLWYRMQSMYGGCCTSIFGRQNFRFFQIGYYMYTMIGFDNGSGGLTYQHPSYNMDTEPGGTTAWHHVVGMRRDNRYIIWIDGVQKYDTTFGTGLELYGATSGGYYINSTSHNADYAVARIWNRGLSNDEILHNFNAQRARFKK
jgi:hypothetical protein